MTRNEYIIRLEGEYEQQRRKNEEELEARIAEIDAVDPKISELKSGIASLALDTMRRLLDPALTQEQRTAIGEETRAKGLKYNAEIRTRLKAAGYPENYLEMRYRCEKCRDTGYVGDVRAMQCECFKNALARLSFSDGGLSEADRQRFECFDLTIFPDEGGQRLNAGRMLSLCERYADSFPHTEKQNLLLTGGSGLGKTFLLNCIYARVIDRGHAATRISAFRLLEAMRRQHLANSPDDYVFDPLLKTPLLLIDDLGTEPMMKNITLEYLYTLLNERMAAGLHTVIATNLSPVKLKETYGERVASRLLDRTKCIPLEFTGKDLRLL